MKKILFSILIITGLFFANTSSAQDYKTALGVRLSSSAAMVNNSISLKHFLNEKAAVEALFSFGDPLALGALLEIHKPLGTQGIQWYYGGGGYIGFVKTFNADKNKDETDVNFGAQGVIGLDYKFVNIPLNLSIDWKPELNIIGDINFEPAAVGFTARFTFGK
ncbi:MAG: hypothetical protein JNK14_15160 [Chitinophagaceae bacterium]|nr:hypothetical protein [Chitinophagaceae bacterium]